MFVFLDPVTSIASFHQKPSSCFQEPLGIFTLNDEQQRLGPFRIHFNKFLQTSMYIRLSWCVLLLHIMRSLRCLVEHWGLLFIFSKFRIAGISPVCYSCVVCIVWKTDLAMSAFYSQRLEWEKRKVISKWIKVIEHFQFCMTSRFLSRVHLTEDCWR